ncbi:type II toxin-antitoxin system PemK/MazF family toxin (plasmid) [Vibrio coralliilyticus]|uniref:type II toxin-antitoxin system PemK/MazF family toxin n=1 Tax=Vibrio coralliilyticus TaxID=190893 RepID=UPI00051279D3|nr:type II toxin-antitoxin system PemK/MazF family toxin [Vibrio coralliilyticus]AIS58274.1 MazF family transcriptional regulator [Vibrio coralliilyticus]
MAQYIPERKDIIWLDFEPVKGEEIGKYRPALVLSSKEYNQQTRLLICCPISTNIRGQASEVPVKNLDKPSVVATSLVQTLSWKDRNAKKITTSENGVMEDVLFRLIPLIGAESLFEE